MSCSQSTAPINISKMSTKDKCLNKCSYFYKYNNSKCIVKNRGNHLQLNYDKSSDSVPVTYNGASLFPVNVKIFSPSLHTYDSNEVSGELIIEHVGDSGATLIVCIPIIRESVRGSKAARMIAKFIRSAARYAPNENDIVNLNQDEYNLNDFVPKSRFYAYRATFYMYPCNGDYQYVVFHPDDSYLPISDDSLNTLKKIIRDANTSIKSGPNLYLNEKGPNSGVKPGDEIYIECKPTGTRGEVLKDEVKSTSSSPDDDNMARTILMIIYSPYFIILLMIFIFYLIFKVLKFSTNKLKDKDFMAPISESKGK